MKTKFDAFINKSLDWQSKKFTFVINADLYS